MRILSRTLAILVPALLFLPRVNAGGDQNRADLQQVVDAERRFARTALERGIRESFLQFLADDSIILAPEPINGKLFYSKLEEKGRRLIWRPTFATIALSGDLGITTGPWEMKKPGTDETSIAFGDFVSVWKKQPDNSWKVVLDVGIDHPRPAGSSPEIELSPANAAPIAGALDAAEKSFADNLETDPGSAVFKSANNGIRVLRNDSFPAVGLEAASKIIPAGPGKMTRKAAGGAKSEAGDLAYRYGSYSWSHSGAVETGQFVTMWQIDGGGDWKIILDLQKKAPAAKQ